MTEQTLALSLVDTGPMVAAFQALASALEKTAHLPVEVANRLIERTRVDADGLVALRATDGRVRPESTDRFRDLCAAFRAVDRDGFAVEVETWHGWPILSVGDRTSTVADAGGVTSASGKGGAAPVEQAA